MFKLSSLHAVTGGERGQLLCFEERQMLKGKCYPCPCQSYQERSSLLFQSDVPDWLIKEKERSDWLLMKRNFLCSLKTKRRFQRTKRPPASLGTGSRNLRFSPFSHVVRKGCAIKIGKNFITKKSVFNKIKLLCNNDIITIFLRSQFWLYFTTSYPPGQR